MPLHGNPITTVSAGASSTHPKITPFRLSFILTTGGLGIAKAVLVSNGKTASSTTLEWILGGVVALIFQFLGCYDSEYNNACPRHLDWLFCYDSLGRPITSIRGPNPDHSTHIVTGYRLLVSAIFAAIGLAKMLCGYLGFSSAMYSYTLDWIITIPLALGLYYIGLYEERRARPLRKFFKVDYSSQTLLTLQIMIYLLVCLGSIPLCIYWSKFWLGVLRSFLAGSYPAPIHAGEPELDSRNAVFEHLLTWTVVSFCIGMLEVGVLGLSGVLWPIIKAYSGRYASSMRGVGLGVVFVTLGGSLFLLCIQATLFHLVHFTHLVVK